MLFGGMCFLAEEGERGTILPLPAKIYHGSLILVALRANGTSARTSSRGTASITPTALGRCRSILRGASSFSIRRTTMFLLQAVASRRSGWRKRCRLGASPSWQAHGCRSRLPRADRRRLRQGGVRRPRSDVQARCRDDARVRRRPFYAIEVMPDILNTQGGPRRNGKAEVLDRDGRPSRTCTRPASSAESPRTCTKAAATWPSA